MKFIVEINCDNAAFAEHPSNEVAGMLDDLAKRVRGTDPADYENDPFIIRDINGNRVGLAHFEEV